jgi:NAD-dependent deacetylase
MAERGTDTEREWQRARELFATARRITALTGAGLSTAAGIPDFRGPNGVWTKNPEAQRLSDIHSYVADPEVRREAWRNRASHPVWDAVPTAGHRAFAELAACGRLRAVLTQNIDELHQRGGLVVCNAEPTPYDAHAAAVLRDPLDEVLPALVAPCTSRPI